VSSCVLGRSAHHHGPVALKRDDDGDDLFFFFFFFFFSGRQCAQGAPSDPSHLSHRRAVSQYVCMYVPVVIITIIIQASHLPHPQSCIDQDRDPLRSEGLLYEDVNWLCDAGRRGCCIIEATISLLPWLDSGCFASSNHLWRSHQYGVKKPLC
jgi:hypothetical protein